MIIRKVAIFSMMIVGLSLFAENVKEYEFAGVFYPEDKEVLCEQIRFYLDMAEVPEIKGEIVGIICPHAGYIYSGAVAAHSFKVIKGKDFNTVVVIGPSHRYYFNGIAIYKQGFFSTPLGKIEIDQEICEMILKEIPFVQDKPQYFTNEHCVEVELPFLKEVLDKFKLVPLLMGRVSSYHQLEELAQMLVLLSKRRKLLVMVSTDLSHYLPYEEAKKIDEETIRYIKEKNTYSLWTSYQRGENRACGILPLLSFLIYVQQRGAEIEILKYANSGDTGADKTRVVGYLSAVGYKKHSIISRKGRKKEEEMMGEYVLTQQEQRILLNIARQSLESYLTKGEVPEFKIESERLKEKRGVFVTLKKYGQLRGCIGRIVADTPLYKTVAEVAIDSAINDPRFPPVEYEELKAIEIEISILSPLEKVNDYNEIVVGRDGLMIQKSGHSGLLLPQVPVENGWDRETFLKHLCYKAGLPPDAYKRKEAVIYRFSAFVFKESDLTGL